MEYKTQMEAAKKGIVTKELAAVAKKEGFTEAELLPLVASGRVIIPANVRHNRSIRTAWGKGCAQRSMSIWAFPAIAPIIARRCRRCSWLSSLAPRPSWI